MNENRLTFNIEESYRYVSLSFLGTLWNFDSHLDVDSLMRLQNYFQAAQEAQYAEASRIRLNVAEGEKVPASEPSTKRIQYQKQAVSFIVKQIQNDKLIMTNEVVDIKDNLINQDFLKSKIDFNKYPFLFTMLTNLGIALCDWADRQVQDLKKK